MYSYRRTTADDTEYGIHTGSTAVTRVPTQLCISYRYVAAAAAAAMRNEARSGQLFLLLQQQLLQQYTAKQQ